ncbi:Peptidase family M28 [Nakaseomyces glabratus]|nr:Peptidase family M28 [Nakaseomyces glabratus]
MLLKNLVYIGSVAALPWSSSWSSLLQDDDSVRTIDVGDGQLRQVTEYDKLKLRRRGIKFFDVTDVLFFRSEEDPVVADYNYPMQMHQRDTVHGVLDKIDKESMYADLSKLTSFYTRYYKSAEGVKSADWVLSRIANITNGLEKDFVQIEQVSHKGWDQYSIVVRFKGTSLPDNIVVIGSHHDSINLLLPSVLPAPGADDNGSGTTTVLEALRVYVEYYIKQNQRPMNTIEFHFYSAEEGGLLGSLDVFTRYARDQKKVVAMLQQDMTGYVRDPAKEHVGLVTDHTTPKLNNFLKLVMNEFLSIPYVETECGYACSDHGSAVKNGFPAAFVIESDFKKTNRYIHSTMDTLDRLSLDHMAEHAKLVLGTVIELGQWLGF